MIFLKISVDVDISGAASYAGKGWRRVSRFSPMRIGFAGDHRWQLYQKTQFQVARPDPVLLFMGVKPGTMTMGRSC